MQSNRVSWIKRGVSSLSLPIRASLSCCFIGFLLWNPIEAQVSYCENLGFEQGNFSNWRGYTWVYSAKPLGINTSPAEGFVSRRHAILSDTSAYDANTGGALRKIPPGYSYSARLGDEIINSDGNPRCWNQSLRYTMAIDSGNALLVVKFALVLQYASDHTSITEPRFCFTLYDSNGDTIPDCSNYLVYASNQKIKGFRNYRPPGEDDMIQWRDWTTVGADLSKYIGQTVTIEFQSADCARQYHYGYAYFVAECHPLYITMHYCTGDTIATLTAPEGFESYKWSDSSESVIDTARNLIVPNPVEGKIYGCEMTSATGCRVSLQSLIARYIIKADFSSHMIDCFSNIVELDNLSTTNHGILHYLWDFGDGSKYSLRDLRYTFATSGMHQVSLILLNPPSSCGDTLIREVESFSPPLVGIAGDSTYCPGQSVFLKAYGAYDYTWSNGTKNDTLEISSPGGEYWLLGRSSTGCVSDTNRISVYEEPDWIFSGEGDTILCEGDSIILSAYGAVNYRWNTGEINDSIRITSPGIYSIAGTNRRGCQKTESFIVKEYPLPDSNFTLSESTLDFRHNQLTCSLPPQQGVQYEWDMGDGSSETGSSILHTYAITSTVLAYTIVLTATSEQGCMSNSSEFIDVIPFVPNVFTPNGDGINDLFMPGFNLEVFDRNGLSLYKGTEGWNGRYKENTAGPDTYFYLINYSDRNQQIHTRKGFITLVL